MKTKTISAKPQQQKMTRDLPPSDAKPIKGGERLAYREYKLKDVMISGVIS